MRFEDRLQVEIDVDEKALDFPVPALILQPIVENAVNHGVSRNPGGGRIRLAAGTDGGRIVLVVEDGGPGLGANASSEGFGVGLANTRERLRALYGDGGDVAVEPAFPDGRGVRVRLLFPQRELYGA